MRAVFVLLLFTVLSNGQWVDDLKLKNNEDDPWSRVERAASATVPPGNATKSSVTELLTRHKKLARVFNALYLDIGLREKTINPLNVVADLWNIENKATIDKLVSVNTEELAGILKTLDDKVKAVPDGSTQIVNVDDLRGKFKNVKKQMIFPKKELIKSDDENNIPHFVRNFLGPPEFSEIYHLEIDLAKKVLTSLETFVTADSLDWGAQQNLLTDIRICEKVFRTMKVIEGDVSADLEETEPLLETFRVAAMYKKGRDAMNELSSSFSNILTKIQPFQSLKNGSDTLKTKKTVLDFRNVFKDLQQPNTEKSIVPMFVSDRKLSVIRSELNESFLKKVLNNGDSLEALEDFFKIVNDLSTRISTLTKESDIILAGNSHSLNSLSEFVIAVNAFQQLSPESQMKNLSSCFEIEEPPALNVTVDLVSSWQTVRDEIPSIRSTLKSIKDGKGTQDKIATYISYMILFEDSEFDKFKTSVKYKEMKTFFEKVSADVSGPLKQKPEFIAAIYTLRSSETLNSFRTIQTWAFDLITKHKLHIDNCKSAFEFDPDFLAPLNDISKTISLLKTEPPIEKLQPLLQAIPQFQADLHSLSSLSPEASAPKNLTVFNARHPHLLLVVAEAVHGLDKLYQINELEKDVDTVIHKGNDVVAAIQNVQDSRKKAELEKTWKEFPTIKLFLTRLKFKSKMVIDLVKSRKPETNLEEVGEVYRLISDIHFNERIQLKKLRMSMKLLDTPNLEVEKALENLEGPVSGNWQRIRHRIATTPEIMGRIQKYFFNDEEEEVVEGGFEKFLMDNLIYLIVGGIILIVVFGVGIFLGVYFHKKRKRESL